MSPNEQFYSELKNLLIKYDVELIDIDRWERDPDGNEVCYSADSYLSIKGDIDYSYTLPEKIKELIKQKK